MYEPFINHSPSTGFPSKSTNPERRAPAASCDGCCSPAAGECAKCCLLPTANPALLISTVGGGDICKCAAGSGTVVAGAAASDTGNTHAFPELLMCAGPGGETPRGDRDRDLGRDPPPAAAAIPAGDGGSDSTSISVGAADEAADAAEAFEAWRRNTGNNIARGQKQHGGCRTGAHKLRNKEPLHCCRYCCRHRCWCNTAPKLKQQG